MDAHTVQFDLIRMLAVANGLFAPIGQRHTGDAQLAPQFLGGLAAGEQQAHCLLFELFAVSIAMVFTHAFTFQRLYRTVHKIGGGSGEAH